jgi:glycerate 2-kinase
VARVVIAPDSFKGSASARDATDAIARGWSAVRPDDELVLVPMADGGEGTLDAFAAAVAGSERRPLRVVGPDDNPVDAEWLLLPDGSAVVELALASGLTLLDPLRPLDAHTFGFGELIAAAVDDGARSLILAIGGSSSTDGGAGALAALGAGLFDSHGHPIARGNRGLADLERVDLSTARSAPESVVVLCDVRNPLLGPDGAAAVFAPQKGAGPADIPLLEANLERFARVLGGDPDFAGAGAAGGTSFGLSRWGAVLAAGAPEVAERLGLVEALVGADVVITGEGRFDSQSASGKVAHYVAELAAKSGVDSALVAGVIEAPTDQFAVSLSLSTLAGTSAAARTYAVRWLEIAGGNLATRFS